MQSVLAIKRSAVGETAFAEEKEKENKTQQLT